MEKRIAPAMVLSLATLSAMGPFATDISLPALPQIAEAFASTQAAGQAVVSATFFGMSLGQAFAGPYTDRLGRRRPAIFGALGFAVVAALCGVAPNMLVLIGLSFLLGAIGAIGIVATRAAVRDIATGNEAARLYSMLGLITSVAPVLSPVLGAQVLRVTDWRGVYFAMAILGLLLGLLAWRALEETLAHHERDARSIRETFGIWAALFRQRAFMSYAFTLVGGAAALFTYISSSPFVLQGIFGMTQQAFSIVFAVNAVGMLVLTQLNMRLVRRFGALHMLTAGVVISFVGSLVLSIGCALVSLPLVWIGFFCIPSSLGFIFSNAMALALETQDRDRGSAAGLLGLLPFTVGILITPLASSGGRETALPVGLTALGLSTIAVLAAISGQRLQRRA